MAFHEINLPQTLFLKKIEKKNKRHADLWQKQTGRIEKGEI